MANLMANSYQHWLKKTPTDYLEDYIQKEWTQSLTPAELRKIRYYSFTIRAFVFRGDRLFLANRNSNPHVTEELTVPTDRFDVTLESFSDMGPPVYRVNQEAKRTIGEHIRIVLSSRYQHPNILQNARFLDEFSFEEPISRRRIEAATWGDTELYLCNLEISVVMSKFDGSLGNGPAYRWITESEAACLDDGPQLVSGMDVFLISEMFGRYRRCRSNQSFHEHCVESMRSALRLRWKQDDIRRPLRYGVIGPRVNLEAQGMWVMNMTAMEAAMRKNATEIYYEGVLYQVVGRFSGEAVQLNPEIEIWQRAVDEHGIVKLGWCEHVPREAFLRLLPP